MKRDVTGAVQLVAALCGAVVLHSLLLEVASWIEWREPPRAKEERRHGVVLRPAGIPVAPETPAPIKTPPRVVVLPVPPEVPGDRDRMGRGAVEWLLRHQLPDGSWSGADDAARCACTDPAGHKGRITETSLAAMALLARGYTHLSRDSWRDPVDDTLRTPGVSLRSAFKWLATRLTAEGAPSSLTAEEEALVVLTFVDAWIHTRADFFSGLAAPALKHLSRRAAESAGFGPEAAGFAILTLERAASSGFPGFAREDAAIQALSASLGRAEGLRGCAIRVVAWEARLGADSPSGDAYARRILDGTPVPDDPHASEDRFWGMVAARRLGPQGTATWLKWWRGVSGMLVEMQRGAASGCAAGSWTPAPGGGRSRAATTALNVLSLESEDFFPPPGNPR